MKTEHEEQRDFVMWFRQTYPDIRIFAIPNGGKRNASEAVRLKCEGVTAGVPDLFIPDWNLWVEMKTEKKGRISDAQKDWIEYLNRIGHTATVANGCDAAKRFVIEFVLMQQAPLP